MCCVFVSPQGPSLLLHEVLFTDLTINTYIIHENRRTQDLSGDLAATHPLNTGTHGARLNAIVTWSLLLLIRGSSGPKGCTGPFPKETLFRGLHGTTSTRPTAPPSTSSTPSLCTGKQTRLRSKRPLAMAKSAQGPVRFCSKIGTCTETIDVTEPRFSRF